MQIVKEQQQKIFDLMKGDFGYTNKLTAPSLEKIIVSVGTGKRSRTDKRWNEFVADRLAKITGQKPAARPAKKSIATFKLREGDAIGQAVTLRGERMFDFFDKLVHIALPRTKDFRGINRTTVDQMGNMTIGIKEHTIFPETGDEELRDVFGISITMVSSAHTRDEAFKFFELLGIPFKKEKTAK